MRPKDPGQRTASAGVVLIPIALLALAGSLGCGPEGEGPPGVNEEYQIVVERTGRIGEREGDGMIIGTVHFSFLDDGRIALTDRGDPGRVKLFQLDGTFLGAFGRAGEGPAELQWPDHVYMVPTGDTLVVLDYALGRISRWARDGTEHYDTRLFPGSMWALFLEDGRVVLNSPYVAPNGPPLPLRLVDREGTGVRAFGTPYRMDAPFESRPSERLLSRGADGTIWEAPFFEYRLAQFDTVGTPVRELYGHHLPMPTPGMHVVTPRTSRDPAPTPFLGGVGWDADQGILWVSVLVGREDWRTRLAARRKVGWPTMEERYGTGSIRRTHLDAWDPERGHLLASKLLDERWRTPVGPGVGLSYASSLEGFLFLDVWRARLVKKRR